MATETEGNGAGSSIPKNFEKAPQYIKDCGAKFGALKNSQGLSLATYLFDQFQGEKPAGVVVLVHGISVHTAFEWFSSIKYDHERGGYENAKAHEPTYNDSFVQVLNKAGFIVAAMDHQSYGLSDGLEKTVHYFKKFDDLVNDQLLFLSETRKNYPGLPIFVCGISMGGCVSALLIQVCEEVKLAGCVLLAPMLSVEKLKKDPRNRLLLPISRFVSIVAPKFRAAKKEVHVNRMVAKTLEDDPLVENASIRTRVATECLAAVDKAMAPQSLEKVKLPLLIIHSKNDTMTDPQGSQTFYKNVPSEDKTLMMRDEPHLWHMLVREPEGNVVGADIASWLKQHT